MPRIQRSAAAVVFLAGVNLILIQWVLVRELTTLLLGTELVVLLVTITYFIGLSIGYAAAGRLSRRWLVPLAVVTLVLHVTLPIWFRVVVILLTSAGRYRDAYIFLPALAPLVISAFYSIFIPLYADSERQSLPVLYAVEVSGSAVGVLVLVGLGGVGLQAVFGVYAVALVGILVLLRLRPVLVGVLAISAAAWLLVLPAASDWSNARWYETVRGLPEGSTTLFSAYTAYQKIDVMETPQGARWLYLDGLSHFGDPSGERLNVVMGYLPGLLAQPDKALVVGAGSMQLARMIAENAGLVTTVEIDPTVVSASTRYFASVNLMDTLTNRRIIIDDGKHFLATTSERFNLIATDVPAAYSIQTASLYSVPFYTSARDHLEPGGFLVVGLTTPFAPDHLVGRRVAASLLAVFDEVMVITPASVGWSFAYAGDSLPFTRAEVETALHDLDETEFILYETDAVRALVGDAPPITIDTMDVVLSVSRDWIADRVRD